MSIVAPDSNITEGPPRRLWTREEFERASELGLFGPDERLELIDGEILEKMTQNSPHSTALCKTEDALRDTFRKGHVVRIQMPLSVGERSQPDPDIAVVLGSVDDFEERHPATAVLVVEISDTTVAFDRNRKAAVYALAGVPDYWILNLNTRRLEIRRDPLDGRYTSLTECSEDEIAHPLAEPQAAIKVADLLPRRRSSA